MKPNTVYKIQQQERLALAADLDDITARLIDLHRKLVSASLEAEEEEDVQ